MTDLTSIRRKKTDEINILFISLLDFNSLNVRNIYTDLLWEMSDYNFHLTIVSPIEKRNYHNQKKLIIEGNTIIIKPVIGNYQKTNFFEKGLSLITLESKMLKEIKQMISQSKVDIVIYTTPPITLIKTIKYIKKKYNAMSYLLLKDIFPQNVIDLQIIKNKLFEKMFFLWFRKREVKLYQLSDYIGCMSERNKQYLIENNKYLDSDKIEVNPNSERVTINETNLKSKNELFGAYEIPTDKTIFIYGGNIGKPQGVSFILSCISENEKRTNAFIVIIGSGTEYDRIYNFIQDNSIKNTKLIPTIGKADFELFVQYSDVGLIFLDHRFTIPNFPSRLLTYMKQSKPILAAIDKSTDIGDIIVQNKFGFSCISNDINVFNELIDKYVNLSSSQLYEMGVNSYDYYIKNYTANKSAEMIIKRFYERDKNYDIRQ